MTIYSNIKIMAQYKNVSFVVVSRKHLMCHQTHKLFFYIGHKFSCLAFFSLVCVNWAVHGITSFSKGMCAALYNQGRVCRRPAVVVQSLLVFVECKAEKAFAEPRHLCLKHTDSDCSKIWVVFCNPLLIKTSIKCKTYYISTNCRDKAEFSCSHIPFLFLV